MGGYLVKVYTVMIVDTDGHQHVVGSGRSGTPFSTEQLGPARTMATREEKKRIGDRVKILVCECDFDTMSINVVETRIVKPNNETAVTASIGKNIAGGSIHA